MLCCPRITGNLPCSSTLPAHFSSPQTPLFLQKPGASQSPLCFHRSVWLLEGWQPRRGQSNQQLQFKSFVESCVQLNEAHWVLHRPSSPQSATRVLELIQFSDVLKQKRNVQRVLPCAARCLTHKPTCKSTRTQASHCQRHCVTSVAFSLEGKAFTGVKLEFKCSCVWTIKITRSYALVWEQAKPAEPVLGMVNLQCFCVLGRFSSE